MKLNKLNLGKALSRDEQKLIKGGDGTCNIGQPLKCYCAGNSSYLCGYPTSNNEDMIQICQDACFQATGSVVSTHGPICNDPWCQP